ncbi:shugoshin 1 [Synchiropus splendidus]|uniref:shugoshin 1 n=1 Tax=Synchiropus splendidus TaxID=270530 RepID=UPI00237E4603|nr:shugoshin 1 [Synchiropus splendidus]
MERQQVQEKSYKASLENIKKQIKEKSNQRLSKVTTRKKGLTGKPAAPSKASLLQSLQQNNKDLATALQAEREKLKTANELIYHLKKENALMFWHIAMLKRGLRQQEKNTSDVLVQSQTNGITSRCQPAVHDEHMDAFENVEHSSTPEEKENSNPRLSKRKSALSENKNGRDRTFRKRRQTDVVSYAEPSLKVKLRQGDKFTDQKFINCPFRRRSALV